MAQFFHEETRRWNRVVQLCYNKVVQATKARVVLGVTSTRLVGWAWRCVVCSLVDPKILISRVIKIDKTGEPPLHAKPLAIGNSPGYGNLSWVMTSTMMVGVAEITTGPL